MPDQRAQFKLLIANYRGPHTVRVIDAATFDEARQAAMAVCEDGFSRHVMVLEEGGAPLGGVRIGDAEEWVPASHYLLQRMIWH